jgi:hypothetical protein
VDAELGHALETERVQACDRRAAACASAAVQCVYGARHALPDQHERVAANAAHVGAHDSKHCRHGYGSVDGIAAIAQNLCAGVRCERMIGYDRSSHDSSGV